MGAVYLAVRGDNPEPVALKLLDVDGLDSPVFRARFEREADLARRLGHPNIVTVLDRGVTVDRMWLAMEYIDGLDVTELTDVSPERAVAIIADAARGIDYAHSRGLLHRDIKPTNILVAADRALITDFGIARSMDEARYANAGETPAALAYTAPEQLEGHAVDHRADVYALGCVLYEMLTGTTPFARWNPLAMVNAHLTETPAAPSSHVPSLPTELDDVLARVLAKHPSERYNSCTEFADAAATAVRPNVSESVEQATSVPSRTRSALLTVGAIATAAVIVGGIVFAIRSPGSGDPAPVAGAATTSESATTTAAAQGYTTKSEQVRGRNALATYDVAIPQVQGKNPAAATAFNTAMRTSLQNQIDVPAAGPFTLSGNRSSVVHAGARVISGILLTDWQSAGTQKTTLIATDVIDVDTATQLTLARLFPDLGTGLQRLSDRSAALLPETAAGTDFLQAGIAPVAPNFVNWVATPQGMAIHFDQGQVAPADAGLIVITVPWSELTGVLDPQLLDVVSS